MKILSLSMISVAVLAMTGAVLLPVGDRRESAGTRDRDPIAPDMPNPVEEVDLDPVEEPFDPRANSSKLIPTERSIRMFEQRVRRTPGDHRNLVILARLHLRLAKESGNHRENTKAEAVLRRALQVKPGDSSATICLAQAINAQHRFAEARELAIALLTADPKNAEALAVAGDAEFQLGLYEEAKQSLACLSKLTGGPAVLTRLADLNHVLGNTDRAREQLLEAHRLIQDADATDDTLAWYEVRLGQLLLQQGEAESAASHFREALQFREDYEPAMFRLGLAEAASGNHDLAASILESVAEVHASPEAWAALGDIHVTAARETQAEECYGKATRLFELQVKSDGAHSRTAAMFYADRKRSLPRAMELMQVDLKSRKSVETLDALAWVQFQSGDETAAAETIEKALAWGTESASLHYHAGVIFESIGDTNRATSHFEKVIAINPEFALLFSTDARQRLARLKAGE